MKQLNGKKVAILAADGFEQSELEQPKEALEAAGAQTFIISPSGANVKGWQHTEWGDEFPVDVKLDDAVPEDYDALLLPGGVMNPDKLRINDKALAIVKAFVESGKVVAAICHAPWLLVETGAVKDREVTSFVSIRTDVINAGGRWVDKQVATEDGIITSRHPGDIDAFVAKIIEEVEEGEHRRAA